MNRFWMVVRRSPALARAVAAVLLCVATAAVQLSGLRYETVRTSLIPGMFAPHWGVSRIGVGVVRDDLSMAVLTRAPGRQVPFLVRDIPNVRQVPAVRISVEARPFNVVAGPEFWQFARVMLWSYGRDGRRLRYMPYELMRLEGSKDWRRASLVVPVMPETAAMRVVIAQAGLTGSVVLRGINVDGVAESGLFRGARALLIALWIALAIWVAVPMFRRITRARAAVAGLLAITLAGAFAPQPFLSDTLVDLAGRTLGAIEPVGRIMARWINPAPPDDKAQAVPIVNLEPGASTAGQGQTAPAGPGQAVPPAAPPGTATSPPAATTLLMADFAPRLNVKWGHFLAFAALAAALPFAFPGARWWQICGALLLFGVAIEMVQGFFITRSPELSDVLRDSAGVAVGFVLALAWQFARDLRKRPA
jgi:hypothetical protein